MKKFKVFVTVLGQRQAFEVEATTWQDARELVKQKLLYAVNNAEVETL